MSLTSKMWLLLQKKQIILRLFDASPTFEENMVKISISNEIEDENSVSRFSQHYYDSSSVECQNAQESKTFRSFKEVNYKTQQEENSEPIIFELMNSQQVISGVSDCSKNVKLEKQIKKFGCPICGKLFVSNKRLRQHKECHSDERPHACKICGTRFKRTSEVTKHMLIHENKKYSCQFCQFKSVHKFAIDMHTKRHFGEYQFKCEICDKGFYTKFDLSNHTVLHSGDRPYRCNVCKLTFLYKNNLLYHKKKIHRDPEQSVELFKCSLCDRSYQCRRSLLVHAQKKHSERESHLCEICGHSLDSGNALRLHKKKTHFVISKPKTNN